MIKRICLPIVLVVIIFVSGCSSSNENSQTLQTLQQENRNLESQISSLKKENETLKNQLDDIQYGAKNLYNNIQTYYKEKSYDKAKDEINTLIQKHPDSEEAKKAKELLKSINDEIKKNEDAEKVAAKQKAEIEKNRLANATKKLKKQYDEVQEITWLFDKSSPEYSDVNSFYTYIGTKKDSAPWIHLKIQYAADDWVFINKYIFKVDDKSFEIDAGDFGVTRDNNGGGIWEVYDLALDKYSYDMIQTIIASKKTIIRHQGKEHYADRTVTASEKQGLKNVLDAYEALGGKLDF